MYSDIEEFLELLPAIIRKRDYEAGGFARSKIDYTGQLTDPADFGPLKSLLSVLLREGQIVQQDIHQLYDDNFIETCADWVIPYIGDLVGAYALENIDGPISLRRHIAATLPLRQRKGTLAALEYTVAIASGWPVRAVEYWKHVSITQSQRRLRMEQGGTVNMSDTSKLSRIGGAFDTIPRFYDSRSVETQSGQWNLPNIGLHVFRLLSVRHGFGQAIVNEGAADPANLALNFGFIVKPISPPKLQYFFSPYKCNQPLFNRPPDLNPGIGEFAREKDMPMGISRYMLRDNPHDYIGPDKAINVVVRNAAGKTQSLKANDVQAANLDGWTISPDPLINYVDPETGRLLLADAHKNHEVFVTCFFGRAFSIGGEQRELSEIPELTTNPDLVMSAVTANPSEPEVPSSIPAIGAALDLHFADSSTYIFKNLHKEAFDNGIFQTRIIATENCWPLIHMGSNTGLTLKCPDSPKSNLLISGLRFVSKQGMSSHLKLGGVDAHITINDCTFVPGHRLDTDGQPKSPGHPSITFAATQTAEISRSILGPIKLANDVEIILNDCIIDAGSPENMAIFAAAGTKGHIISLNRCTIIGRIDVGAIGGGDHYTDLAKASRFGFKIKSGGNTDDDASPEGIRDSIIYATAPAGVAPVHADNIQTGCVRFSFIPNGSRVPKMFKCWNPDSAFMSRDWPRFNSQKFIDPDYCQLRLRNVPQILEGGENGSEMGVGNAQNNRARLANLFRAKDEFMRFGYYAGPIFEN